MQRTLWLLVCLFVVGLCLSAQPEPKPADERLGTVAFPTSCSAAVQAPFNRGVALLHDFWYEEAKHQFEEIAAADPSCAMAHWGIAMSVFHQIWDRPQPAAMTLGWEELQKAQSPVTARERAYIEALRTFYRPGAAGFEERSTAYSDAMAKIYRDYPDDPDAVAFYALSLLAAEKPDDTSLHAERAALVVLNPMFAKYPDHPGLAHYIIHASDNPALASDALQAAQRYGTIAPSAAHSAHMPGHIFARLGLWQPDIEANVISITAANKALPNHPSALFDQLHSYDFLLYAYLQSGQDANAKAVVDATAAVLDRAAAMPKMPGMDMSSMVPFYREEFPTIYALEMRDWEAATRITAESGATPQAQRFAYWAHIIGEGHLHQAAAARKDWATYQSLTEQIKKGSHAYIVASTGSQIMEDELTGWVAFASGDGAHAIEHMRAAADLQDKVGQGEVDVPAREMLADMLLALEKPQQALVEYGLALKGSPNRFNGLYNAGRAAEATGDRAKAADYYSALLQSTGNGAQSSRPEFARIREFLSSQQTASAK